MKLAVDLVTIEGRTLLSVIDYGSCFPILYALHSTTTSADIEEVDSIFTTFGLLPSLVSNNGPKFIAERMVSFFHHLGVRRICSSPHYRRSNGMVLCLHCVVKDRMLTLKPRLLFQALFDIRSYRHCMLWTSPNDTLFSCSLR